MRSDVRILYCGPTRSLILLISFSVLILTFNKGTLPVFGSFIKRQNNRESRVTVKPLGQGLPVYTLPPEPECFLGRRGEVSRVPPGPEVRRCPGTTSLEVLPLTVTNTEVTYRRGDPNLPITPLSPHWRVGPGLDSVSVFLIPSRHQFG